MGEQRRRQDAMANLPSGERRKLALAMVVEQLNRVFNGGETLSNPVSFVLLTFPSHGLTKPQPDCCLSNTSKDRVESALRLQLDMMNDGPVGEG